MYLQDRIEELNSGILNIENNKVFVTGFLSQERLEDYYFNNKQCFFSKGIYDYEELDFSKIKDDALFMVFKNNNLISKYCYKVIFKDTLKYKEGKKYLSRTFKIRKSLFSEEYNLIIENTSLVYSDLFELKNFLQSNFKYELNLI